MQEYALHRYFELRPVFRIEPGDHVEQQLDDFRR